MQVNVYAIVICNSYIQVNVYNIPDESSVMIYTGKCVYAIGKYR